MKINQIKVGAILSYLSMGLSTVISLVYTPIMIARLGDSEYGVYNLVLPIISYLNLLSFGLGSAYVRYYSRYKVEDNKQGMARINGMFLTTYTVLGALVIVLLKNLVSENIPLIGDFVAEVIHAIEARM